MAYLNSANVTLPVGSKIFDGAKARALLSVKFNQYRIKTKGNVDVVMAAARHRSVDTTKQNMWSAIQLKKQDNDADIEIRRQVVLQHLSASFLNRDTGILTIMTDLGPRWHFYWFSKGQNRLMEYRATSKGEANYLIRHMMEDASSTTSAPTDFLNRSSWNRMYPPQMELDEEGHHDYGRESGSPDNSPSRSSSGGPPKNYHSKSSGNSAGMANHAEIRNSEFMDEEEERDVKFIEVIECLLPQLGFDPSETELHQGQYVDGPPMLIEFS